jgi:hypothetical protein
MRVAGIKPNTAAGEGLKKNTARCAFAFFNPLFSTSPLRLARVAAATEGEGVARQRRG